MELDDQHYEQKVQELKEEKKRKVNFKPGERKKFRNDMKRCRRSIKRSERQQVEKFIEEEIENKEQAFEEST